MKKHLNIVALTAAIVLTTVAATAQHGLSYNQFPQLRNAINGSLTMMDPSGGATLFTRQQWMGLDGAPQAYWANAHMGIKKIGMTVGIDLKQGSIGVTKDQEISAYAASAVRLSQDEHIALSMGGGVLLHNADYASLDNTDPAFADNTKYNQAIMSLAISYFRQDKYYFGVSIPRFALSKPSNAMDEGFQRVYYITAGALFQLDEAFHIKPSLIVSHMEDNTPRYDVNALAFFAEKFGVGIGLQNQGDLSGLLQLNMGSFAIGYSYQFNPGSTPANNRMSDNTHEVGIRYRVGGMKLL